MSQAKYQHFTPRLHLRKFAGQQPRGSVWEYDKARLSVAPKIPEATGGQRYLYSMKKPDGGHDHSLDHLLTSIEDKAAEGYERLLAGEIVEGQVRADFSAFVATMYTRAPGVLRSLAEVYGKMLQIDMGIQWSTRERFEASLDQMDRALGKSADDRDKLWEFWQDKEGFSLGTSIQHGLIGIGASDQIMQVLYERHWYILDAVEGYFITSDQAVERWAPNVHPVMGDGGFMNKLAETTLPLSPARMLMITGYPLGTERLPLLRDQVEMANALRARHAERFLWADRKDQAVLDLAKEFADDRRGIDVSWGEELAEVVVERSLRGSAPSKARLDPGRR